MSKFCKDQQCNRLGELLRLSEFPRNRQSSDGHYLYCRECCRRRSRAAREAKGARAYRRRDPERKPLQLAFARNGIALCKVYNAIVKGLRTRERIQRTTRLSYDEIGEALCELWEAKAVLIRDREILLAEEVVKRAA